MYYVARKLKEENLQGHIYLGRNSKDTRYITYVVLGSKGGTYY